MSKEMALDTVTVYCSNMNIFETEYQTFQKHLCRPDLTMTF